MISISTHSSSQSWSVDPAHIVARGGDLRYVMEETGSITLSPWITDEVASLLVLFIEQGVDMYLGRRDLCKHVPPEFGAALFYYGMDSKHVVPIILHGFTKSGEIPTWIPSDASFAIDVADMHVFEFFCREVFRVCTAGGVLLLNTPMSLAYLKRKALDTFPELKDQCPDHTLVNAFIHNHMWSGYKFRNRDQVFGCFRGIHTFPSNDYSMKNALSIAAAMGRLEPGLVHFEERPLHLLRGFDHIMYRKIKCNVTALYFGCTPKFAYCTLFKGLGPNRPTTLEERYKNLIERLIEKRDIGLLYQAMPLAKFKAIVASL